MLGNTARLSKLFMFTRFIGQGRDVFVNFLNIGQAALGLVLSWWLRVGFPLDSVLQLLEEVWHALLTVNLGGLTLEVRI